jgi:hypothetical protein
MVHHTPTLGPMALAFGRTLIKFLNLWHKTNGEIQINTKFKRMLQLKYQGYISVKSPIKKGQEEVYLMDIANPLLNLEKQRKYKNKFFYIHGNMDMVDQSRSPLHNCSIDGKENTKFPIA